MIFLQAVKDANYIKMTETPIPKLILKLAIPTTISMVISSIYNMADTFFVSLLDDTNQTGAVGAVFALMAIIQAVGFTIGMGAGSWISRLLGKKENEYASKIGISAIVMALGFGALILILGKLFIEELMFIIGIEDQILPYAIQYGNYILFAAPIMALSFTLNNILRGEGKATFSMIGIGLGGLLNMALDPVFIFVLNMEVAGAALATAISQGISCILLLAPFILKKTSVKLSFKKISTRFSDYVDILKFGMPSFCRQGLSSASSVVLNHCVNIAAQGCSNSAIAAMGVVSRVFMFAFSLCLGLGQGYQPVLGFNYGAKKYRRVKKAFNFTLTVSTAMFVAAAALGYIFAPYIMGIFSGNDEIMRNIGTQAFRAQCIAMPFLPVGVMCNMTYQSLGRSGIATFLSCLRQGLFYIPLMICLSSFVGLFGVEWSQAISDILTCFVSIPFAILFFKEINKKIASEEKDG